MTLYDEFINILFSVSPLAVNYLHSFLNPIWITTSINHNQIIFILKGGKTIDFRHECIMIDEVECSYEEFFNKYNLDIENAMYYVL